MTPPNPPHQDAVERVKLEEVARIIDPDAWGVLDGSIPQRPMDQRTRDRFEAWKQSSLRKGRLILSRLEQLEKEGGSSVAESALALHGSSTETEGH